MLWDDRVKEWLELPVTQAFISELYKDYVNLTDSIALLSADVSDRELFITIGLARASKTLLEDLTNGNILNPDMEEVSEN